MKLDSLQPGVELLRLNFQNWSSKSESGTTEPEWHASTWVQLKERPSLYSHDEALLLCQHSDTEWVVWIPEYGEAILDRCQFCASL
jgi:hypothetical protein